MWNTQSDEKFSLFLFQFRSVQACFLPLNHNRQKGVILNCFYVHKNPLRLEKLKK